jgi:hypothetical protein
MDEYDFDADGYAVDPEGDSYWDRFASFVDEYTYSPTEIREDIASLGVFVADQVDEARDDLGENYRATIDVVPETAGAAAFGFSAGQAAVGVVTAGAAVGAYLTRDKWWPFVSKLLGL